MNNSKEAYEEIVAMGKRAEKAAKAFMKPKKTKIYQCNCGNYTGSKEGLFVHRSLKHSSPPTR